MKLHALPLVLASVALAFTASTSSAQDTTGKSAADAAAASKARKVAQATPPVKKPAVERVGTKPATPAAAQSSPAEDRRFQNCHGKESDA